MDGEGGAVTKSKIRRTASPRATITVSDSYGIRPTGTLRVYSGSTAIKSVTMGASQNGKVTVTLKRLSVGRHYIRAKYLGNSKLAPSTSARVLLTVTR